MLSPWRVSRKWSSGPHRRSRVVGLLAAVVLLTSALAFPTVPAQADGALAFSGWEPLGGVSAGAPSVTTWGPGRLDVFVRGSDNKLWHKWYAGGWSGWEGLGSPPRGLGSDPVAVAWGPGRLDVFAAGVDGQLWHIWYDGGWSGWEPLGGTVVGAPAAASWAPGRLDVFVEGADRALYTRTYDGGWSGWSRIGGVLTAAPTAVSWGPGRIDVVVRGADDQAWHTWFDGGWHGFEPLGGQLANPAAMSAWAPGRLDIFAEGVDGRLYHQWYDEGWSGWELAAVGPLTSAPSVASWAPGRVDVVARGADNGIWHLVAGAGRWTPPTGNLPWQWEIDHPLDVGSPADMGTAARLPDGSAAPDPVVYDIDGFANPAATVTALHGMGFHAICYIEVGAAESFRPDYGLFPPAALGLTMPDFPSERYVDIRDPTVVSIVENRISMCAAKGFDAIEPDIDESYASSTGFPLTKDIEESYMRTLISFAHGLGVSMLMKNPDDTGDSYAADMVPYADGVLSEQCNENGTCAALAGYTAAGKAVFNAEYNLATGQFCPADNARDFDGALFSVALAGPRSPCR